MTNLLTQARTNARKGVFDPDVSAQTRQRVAERSVLLLDQVVGEIEGYLCIWGDPEHRDAYGTFFDKARIPDMGLERGMHRRPLMYEHGQDPVIGRAIIGHIEDIFFDDIGIRYRGYLDRSSPFFLRIITELRLRLLKTSSGTMEHTGDFYEDGAFKTWVLGEESLTQRPAEERIPDTVLVRSQEEQRKAARAGKHVGITRLPKHLNLESGGQNRMLTPEEQALFDELLASGMSEEEILAYLESQRSDSDEDAMTPEEEAIAEELRSQGRSDEEIDAYLEGLAAGVQQAAAATEAIADAGGAASEPDDPPVLNRSRSDASRLIAGFRHLAAERKRSKQETEREARLARIEKEITAMRNAPPNRNGAVRGHTPQGGARGQITNMLDLRTSHLNTSAMLLIAETMRNRGGVSEHFQRALAHRLFDDAEKGKIRNVQINQFVRSRKADGLISNVRADELMATDIAGQGEEWTSVAYLDFLWDKVRIAPITQELLNRGMQQHEIGQGEESAKIFTADADPVWYSAPEANNMDVTGRPEVTAQVSYVGTGVIEVKPGLLKAYVAHSVELEEDSMIPVANAVQSRLEISGAEILESIIINGDTELGTSNINFDGGVLPIGVQSPYYINSNGLIKNALATSGRNYDANGTHTEFTYNAVIKLMPEEVIADPTKLLFLLSVMTHQKAMEIPAFKTLDVAGQNYTLQTGKLPPVWGVQPLQSARIRQASNNGKVSSTPGNNTFGRILLVFPEYWALVFKRRFTLETDRDIRSGTSEFVASMRVAIQKRSNDASAIAYEVAI